LAHYLPLLSGFAYLNSRCIEKIFHSASDQIERSCPEIVESVVFRGIRNSAGHCVSSPIGLWSWHWFEWPKWLPKVISNI